LGVEGVQTAGRPRGKILRVAVCGGAGGRFWQRAKAAGAEVFVTGEVDYHQAKAAEEAGLCVVQVGHFASEYPVVEVLAERLRGEFAARNLAVEVVSGFPAKDVWRYIVH